MRSGGRLVKAVSDRRGLLPFVILVASALVGLGFVGLGTTLFNRAPVEANQQAASDPASKGCSDAPASDSACSEGEHQEEHREAASEPAITGCSGDPAADFVCLQKRYEDLVSNSGVEFAFAELKNELTYNELARSSCHELTHIIGHVASELYGDVATTYSRGDS